MQLSDDQVEGIIEAAGSRQSAVRNAFEALGYTRATVQPEPVQGPAEEQGEYTDEG